MICYQSTPLNYGDVMKKPAYLSPNDGKKMHIENHSDTYTSDGAQYGILLVGGSSRTRTVSI